MDHLLVRKLGHYGITGVAKKWLIINTDSYIKTRFATVWSGNFIFFHIMAERRAGKWGDCRPPADCSPSGHPPRTRPTDESGVRARRPSSHAVAALNRRDTPVARWRTRAAPQSTEAPSGGTAEVALRQKTWLKWMAPSVLSCRRHYYTRSYTIRYVCMRGAYR